MLYCFVVHFVQLARSYAYIVAAPRDRAVGTQSVTLLKIEDRPGRLGPYEAIYRDRSSPASPVFHPPYVECRLDDQNIVERVSSIDADRIFDHLNLPLKRLAKA
jgi:hypothetical protein